MDDSSNEDVVGSYQNSTIVTTNGKAISCKNHFEVDITESYSHTSSSQAVDTNVDDINFGVPTFVIDCINCILHH